MKVHIGRVRDNAGLVVHLSIGGDPCACGHTPKTEVTRLGAKTRLCKRGFADHRIAAAQQANNYAGPGRFSTTVATFLADVVESRRTPEERAASAAKFADTQLAKDMADVAADTYEAQIARRHRTWAEIRADHHPEMAGQLALIPAA